MPDALTQRQQFVLDHLTRAIAQLGYPPSIRELCRDLKIKSLRGVTLHLDALARKGYLERTRGARSIRLIADAAGRAMQRACAVPVLGRVAAGQPLLTDEQVEDTLAVDERWAGRGATFALRVKGESMINAGILDGDYVLVRRQASAEHGQIVVALLEDEATVKRFVREGDRVLLKSEHPRMRPIVVERGEPLRILGRVIGVHRVLSSAA